MVEGAGAPAGIAGRDRERAALLETLDEDGPLVAFVHGPAGIGKSALLRSFATDAQGAGATTVWLDCRTFEPTAHGFLDALGQALGSRSSDDVVTAASALEHLGAVVVLVVDNYEVFRISDTGFTPCSRRRWRNGFASSSPDESPRSRRGSTPAARPMRSAACCSAH